MKNGVYQIRNIHNKKVYIGSASHTKGFSDRWALHVRQLEKYKHHSIKLQRAWNKYGSDAFVFEVLLYCDPRDCLMYEQIALDYYKPEYNICRVAGSTLGFKHSVLSRKRISVAKKGSRHSQKAIENMRQSHIGIRPSEATRIKLSQAKLGEKHPMSKLTVDNVKIIKLLLQEGLPQKEIATRFNVSQVTISRIKNTKTWHLVSV